MSFSRPRRDREEEDGHAGGDDHRGSMPAKRPRRCSCCQEAKDFSEGQIEILKKEMQCMSKGFIEERKNLQREMQEFYQNSQLQLCELISEQHKRMELISEQFNTSISDIRTPGDHVWKYSNFRALSHQNKIRTYRLKFENKCCNAKYSRHDITADDGNPIKVAIYDHDNQIISNGSLSSMQVQIVVLDGEFNKENKEQWSRDSFIKSIVYGRTGKLPLFANELYLRLENGVANLFDAKFQDNSSFVPSKKFRLGVTATDDSISKEVLEGISESFAVKDGRGFQAKKEPYPSLSDPIYKLKKIAVNGDRRKLLEKMHIKLVRDFLRFYNKDKNCLRKVCGNISDHDWDIIVKHALSCKPGHEQYSYDIPAMDATIFFNSLYKIVGAEFNGKYTFYEELNDTQKGLLEASKTKAYDNLKLVQYEDKNSYHGQCQGSMPPSPTSSPMFHDESSYHREVLESHPEQESPRPCQRWVKIVTLVKTIHFWNKESMWSASIREMLSTPLTESFGMADMLDN